MCGWTHRRDAGKNDVDGGGDAGGAGRTLTPAGGRLPRCSCAWSPRRRPGPNDACNPGTVIVNYNSKPGPRARMDREWNDSQPIYRQLRDRVVAMILDGTLKEGDPLPSVRTVASENRVNPLTVMKGYQQLVDDGLVESRRGLGMFINAGARKLLLQGERQRFLAEEWPRIRAVI